MASSDNVLRGGLTPKHVDVDELLAVLDVRPGPPPVVQAVVDGMIRRFPTPNDEFELSLLELTEATADIPGASPRIVLCLDGYVALSTPHDEVRLPKGSAAWVPADDGPLLLTGPALAVVATTP